MTSTFPRDTHVTKLLDRKELFPQTLSFLVFYIILRVINLKSLSLVFNVHFETLTFSFIVRGVLSRIRKRGKRLGLVWMDVALLHIIVT